MQLTYSFLILHNRNIQLRRFVRIAIKVYEVARMRKKIDKFRACYIYTACATELRLELDLAAICAHISTIARDIYAFPRKCSRNIRAWMIYARACRYTETLGMIMSYLPHDAFLAFFQLCRNPTWSGEGGREGRANGLGKWGGRQNRARRSINS